MGLDVPRSEETKPWKGKTIFRFSCDQDVDYGIESREIRGSMTDLDYVGSERTGDEGIHGSLRRRHDPRKAASPGERGPSSALAVLRSHAKDHVTRAKQIFGGTPTERLRVDPPNAYNCAIQDLTPSALGFLMILGTSIIPKIERTHEMIRTGVIPDLGCGHQSEC